MKMDAPEMEMKFIWEWEKKRRNLADYEIERIKEAMEENGDKEELWKRLD
jgi:hypothetical protein